MARPCTICAHEDRKAIDEALVVGTPVRAIALRYGVERTSLGRHLHHHVSPALARVVTKRQEKREERAARSLLERMEGLIERTERLLSAAETSGAVGQALASIAQLWKGYELLGKLTGEIRPDNQVLVVNLQQSPEWVELRSRLFFALQPFPEARERVAAALTGDVIDGEVLQRGA